MKNIKLLFVLATVLISVCSVSAQDKERDFRDAISQVVKGFSTQNDALIISRLDKELGLTLIYTQGAAEVFKSERNFSFKRPVPYDNPFEAIVCNNLEVKKEALPKKDCVKNTWSKTEGVYCDLSSIDNRLSSLVKFHIDFMNSDFTQEDYDNAVELEKCSRRLVVRDSGKNALVFHLSWLKGKWYFTILDRAAGDCSK